MSLLIPKIRVLLSYIKHYFYGKRNHNIYYIDNTRKDVLSKKNISNDLVSNILIITKNNVESLRKLEEFIEPALFIKMKRFILDGYGFYLIGSGDDLLSFGFVSLLKRGKISPLYGWAEYHLKIFDSKKIFFIHHCNTVENYRNKGLYTYLLYRMATFLLAHYDDHVIVIDAGTTNIPANKAIGHAGFQKVGRLSYKNIVGAKFYAFKKT